MTIESRNLIGPYVDVRSFAPSLDYPRDGSKDWQPYIQKAVDHIVNQSISEVGTLYFPPGRYRIETPIVVSKTIPVDPLKPNGDKRYDQCSIQIMGDAPPFPSAPPLGSSFNGAVIITKFGDHGNYGDRPALCIELGIAKIKLVLCDDEGNSIAGAKAKDYAIAVGNETLDEIEAAVEDFKLKALPELEYELLSVAQERLSQQVKKKPRS